MARGGNDIGVLYYIESEEQNAVKIGFAEKPWPAARQFADGKPGNSENQMDAKRDP